MLIRVVVVYGAVALLSGCGVINDELFYNDAEGREFREFLISNPNVAAAIPYIEETIGGKVIDAEYKTARIVEYEVLRPSGEEQEVLYSMEKGEIVDRLQAN